MSNNPGQGAPQSQPAGAGQPGLATLFRRLIQLLTLQNILTIVEIIGVPVAIWALWLTYGQSKLATEQVTQAQEQIKLGTTQVELAQQALRDQRVSSAWQILATKGNGSTGKQYAISTLMALDGRLVGIDLSCELETRKELATGMDKTACYNPPDLEGLALSPGVQPDGTPRQALIERSVFHQTNFTGASFDGISITNTDFSRARLTNVTFLNSVLDVVTFSGAELRGVTFPDSLLIEIDFSDSDISDASLEGISIGAGQARDMLLQMPRNIDLSNTILCDQGGCALGIDQAFLDQSWYLSSAPPMGLERLTDTSLTIMSGCEAIPGVPDSQLHDRYTCNNTMISVGELAARTVEPST